MLRVLQSFDCERNKQSNLVERLQERLSRAQEEMAQRTSHYQSLHTELLDKISQGSDTEKEVIIILIFGTFLQNLEISSFLLAAELIITNLVGNCSNKIEIIAGSFMVMCFSSVQSQDVCTVYTVYFSWCS